MKEMELELEKAVIEESSILKKTVSTLTSNSIYVRHKKLEELSKIQKNYFIEKIDEIIKN